MVNYFCFSRREKVEKLVRKMKQHAGAVTRNAKEQIQDIISNGTTAEKRLAFGNL
jgi:hypothetical protein